MTNEVVNDSPRSRHRHFKTGRQKHEPSEAAEVFKTVPLIAHK
ncbi:hypothetical protein [Acidithiobacillus ferrivorans]|nr:hypothetical protein [Acidithiobacillus ferrivorans]